MVETHISWVLLTGRYAYKIKKPLDLGFLDFSTLDKRRAACEAELALNRRYTPELYLAVLPITHDGGQVRVGAPGTAVEYCVQMRQFDAEARLDRVLARGELPPPALDAFAQHLAEIHARAPRAGADSPYGTPEAVWQPCEENFRHLAALHCDHDLGALDALHEWSRTRFDQLRETFAQRRAAGFVRELHGDAHLANMVWLDGAIRLFDCIEFNASLRWIDTMSELAFLVMDLDDRDAPHLARRVRQSYLEAAGDYDGLHVLRFYQVYRALVRAKVAAIRAGEIAPGALAHDAALNECRRYLELAQGYTRPAPVFLAVTHGLSGSGKTTLTGELVQAVESVRVRSDVERKRLAGLAPETRAAAAPGTGLYAPEVSRRTYDRLHAIAEGIVRAGYAAVVDATFLDPAQRARFRSLADALGVPFVLLHFEAPTDVLRARLAARSGDASDADLAVLEHQLRGDHALTDAERAGAVIIDTGAPDAAARLARSVAERLQNPPRNRR